MTRFYLFTEKSITDRFFCGNIYNSNPSDTIRFHGCPMTFEECENEGNCKSFETKKEANEYSNSEESAMADSNAYAVNAMRSEEYYGCEGVDDCRYEY